MRSGIVLPHKYYPIIFGKNIKKKDYKKIKMDNEAVYSVTPYEYAVKIAKIVKKYIDPKKSVLTDCSACVGSDTINFAKHFKKVNSIELDKTRYRYLLNNIQLSRLKNINTIRGDCLKHIKKLNQDVIYIDPPWGGKEYKKDEKIELYMSKRKLINIIKSFIKNKYAKLIVLKLPKNYDFEKLEKLKNIKSYKKYVIERIALVVLEI